MKCNEIVLTHYCLKCLYLKNQVTRAISRDILCRIGNGSIDPS